LELFPLYQTSAGLTFFFSQSVLLLAQDIAKEVSNNMMMANLNFFIVLDFNTKVTTHSMKRVN
jgi:hypothetical protein